MRLRPDLSLVPFPLFAFATASPTQSFVDSEHTFVPDVGPHVLVAADFDGDGDEDLLAQATNPLLGGWRLLENDGNGVFEARQGTQLVAANTFSSATAADLDGDGHIDVAVTGYLSFGGGAWVLWNDGTGSFTVQVIATVGPFHRVLPVDLDGDNDLDLAIAAGASHAPAECMLFRNDGNRTFTDVSTLMRPAPPEQRASVAALDVQGDGRVDLVFDGNPVLTMLQNQNGEFVATPGALGPPLPLYGVGAVDTDGDGDADLVGQSGTGSTGIGITLLRNDGGGTFTRLFAPTADVAAWRVADIDGDNDLDFLTQRLTLNSIQLWRNDPGFTLVDVTATGLVADPDGTLLTAAFVDSDGDGDPDLYHPSLRDLRHNDGTGTFRDLRPTRSPDAPRGAAPTDLDGDGDIDLVGFDAPTEAGFAGPAELALWRNLGTGDFAKVTVLGVMDVCDESAVVLFDMDGDGDDDIWALTCANLDRVWENAGATGYIERSATAFPADSRFDHSVLVHDYDGDGDLDAFVARDFYFDSFYINQGNFTFTEEGTTRLTDGEDTNAAVALDFDDDGDMDLALANTTTPLRLFENDGTGYFSDATAGRVPNLTTTFRYMLDFDMDGDGDSDLLLVEQSPLAQPTLLRNDGGVFVETALPLMPSGSRDWPSAADFDLDGDVDLLIGSLWLQNDGTGTFTLAPTQPEIAAPEVRRPVTLTDLDGDGDPDVLSAPLQYHRHRQLENRIPPRTGLTAVARLHALPEAANWTPFGVLYTAAGLAPATSVAPFGTLFLQQSTLTPLVTLFVDPATFTADAAYPIPANPGLIGVSFPMQAIVAHGPASAHTTNAVLVTVEQ